MPQPSRPEILLVSQADVFDAANEHRVVRETWEEGMQSLRDVVTDYVGRVLSFTGEEAIHRWASLSHADVFLYSQIVRKPGLYPYYRFIVNRPHDSRPRMYISDFVVTTSHRGIGVQHTDRDQRQQDGEWVHSDVAGPLIVPTDSQIFIDEGLQYNPNHSQPPIFESYPIEQLRHEIPKQVTAAAELAQWLEIAGLDSLQPQQVLSSL